MLILVGVTVTVAINGGLFEKSKEAAKGTEIGREKEELTSATTTAYDVETGVIKEDDLNKALNGWTVVGNVDGSYTVISPKGNNYKITSNGTVLEENTLAYIYCPKEDCIDNTHLHKGDYVEYKPTTVTQAYAPDKGEGIGKYTGYTKGDSEQSIQQDTLKWRVLGMNENDEILLISEAPTNKELRFYGYVGYNNYETVLNDTCKALYSNTELGATARSITTEDIDKYLGGSKYDKTTFESGTCKYGYQNENAITSKFKYDKKNSTLTKEDYTIPTKDLTSNGYYYNATSELIGAKNREILLGKIGTYCNWVASRAVGVFYRGFATWCMVCVRNGYVDAGYYFCDSYGGEYDISLCLRPIVSLPSSITIDQVSKIEG